MSVEDKDPSGKTIGLFKRTKDRFVNRNFLALFNNALWLFSDKIFRQGLNFLLTAYIARYLGLEDFGVWNYVIAFVVLFSFFSTLGIYNQLLRDFVRYPEKKYDLLGSAFIIKLTGGLVTLALSYATIVLMKPGHTDLHQLVALLAIGYVIQSFDVIDFFFQSQLKAKWITISRLMSFFIFGLLKVTFVHFKLPLIYFVWAQIGELFLASLFLIFFFCKNVGSILKWNVRLSALKGMLVESLPIMFAEIAILMYMRIDQIMIGEIIGNRVLGVYSAAVRLSELWYLIPGVICSTVFPSIINAYGRDELDYNRKLQRLYDFLIWLAISIGIVVSVAAPYIVELLYGSEYAEASDILIIHIWTSVFVFSGFASNQQLVLENLARFSFFRTIVGVIVNVGLNFILIPLWGAKGAAFATLIAQAFSSIFSSYFFIQTRPIFHMNMATMNPRRIFSKFARFNN